MSSEIDIYNQALIANGLDQILSFDGEDKPNVVGKALYPKLRDQEQAKFLWNFAIDRAQLAASAEEPVYGYGFKIPFPTDLLRLLEAESVRLVPSIRSLGNLDFAPYKVEGRFILTNEAPINIKFIKRITDPTLFSVMFVDVLQARIAAEIAIPLRNDMVMADRLATRYERLSATARMSDATEDGPTRLDADDLLISRGDFNISQIPRRL